MPVYALLGATGSTGSAIVRCLLSQPPQDLTLKVFVRSRSKLVSKFPEIENTTVFKLVIIEGTLSDATAMGECLEDADVVMGCIGSNISIPGISLVYDTTVAVVDAVKHHQQVQGAEYKSPTVIQLRSASLNPVCKARLSWLAQNAAPFCFLHIYQDLTKACNLLASSDSKLLKYVLIDPPSIHDADGTTTTGYKLVLDGKQDPALSYADLGAAFCEVAMRKHEFLGQAVGVTATGDVNLTRGVLIGYMATGVKSRIWG